MTNHRSERPPVRDETENRDGESFVGRWLRRKRAAREGRSAAPQTPPHAEGVPEAPADAVQAQPTDADLPSLDSLDDTSDYADFLSPRVSETLRRQALRKLFMSAKFNIVDGLDDYAEDYRTFHALGDIITSDMRYAMQREADKARARADSARPAEGEEEPADARGEDASGSTLADGADPQRALREQAEGEEGDETGSA